MTKNNSFQSITLYKDMAPQVEELTDGEAGKIYKAIFKYACYGEDTDFSKKNRLVRSTWRTTKMKLIAGEKHRDHISDVRAEAGRKGGQAKAGNSQQMVANEAKAGNDPTYTDTVTGTNTDTISSTVTKTETETACADSDDRHAASAAAIAAPPASDLFSVAQLLANTTKNKVNLTAEGVQVFHEEMQGNGWQLYDRPVEKRTITRVLREWAKRHPEYHNVGSKKPARKKSKEDEVEDSIWKVTETYISDQLYEELAEQNTTKEMVVQYCPKEAFTQKQLEFMAKDEDWGIHPVPQSMVKIDTYLHRESED